MRPTILLVLLILIPLVSSLSVGETKQVCENSYHFIIENIKGNKLSYTTNELEHFLSDLDFPLTKQEALSYINNYDIECKGYFNKEVPDYSITRSVGEITEEYECDNEIDSNFLGYPMDLSMPFIKIHQGMEDCDSIEIKKYFLRYEKTGQYDYSITGIKLWWIFTLIILVISILFYKINRRINKELNVS